MYSPFYRFLIHHHLRYNLKKSHQSDRLGFIFYNLSNKHIPLSEKYETIDFTPKDYLKKII